MGFHCHRGYPQKMDGLFHGKSHLEMDDAMTQETSDYICIDHLIPFPNVKEVPKMPFFCQIY